jgi:nucleotide-binding universal stress UspA family protein
MLLRDLIVFTDNTPACAERIGIAVALAERFDAHLVGVGLAAPLVLPPVMEAIDIAPIIAAHEEANAVAQKRAAELFRSAVEGRALRHEWRTDHGALAESAAVHARAADLAVVGQVPSDETGFLQPVLHPEDVTMLSGRPVLVVPYVGHYPKLGSNPLIAWKPTREAARAVADALPLLKVAKRATILVVDPGDEDGPEPAADMAVHLARHGVGARVERTVSDGIDVADIILSRAADLDADLLVMGAYGHGRLRELVLGGVTRTILNRMTLPVLMAH